jgi:uncharacterized protein (DUF2249 family)
MARLVTVEQAARMGGVAVDQLLRDLNGALAGSASGAAIPAPACAKPPLASEQAAALHGYPAGREVVEVDVREDLRAGREPFSRIMAAVNALGAAQVLRVRAIFEPVPLFSALAKRGFTHASQQDGPDDWSVWFWRADAEAAAPAPSRSDRQPAHSDGAPPEPGTVWLDVRGLMPPEPLMRTLAALDTLPEGHQLVQVNARVPELLFPVLAERGFACEVDDSRADRVVVRVWRAGSR